jgi:hypothetical protein
MKTLVLENISYLDDNIIHYLNQNDIDYNVIYNIDRNIEHVIEAIKTHDRLIISSTLGNDEQNRNILQLILQTKTIKEIQILYLYENPGNSKFIDEINSWSEEDKETLKQIFKFCTLKQIVENVYEVQTKDMYFKKFKYYFDTVPIYFNDKFNVFYYTRLPQIGLLNSELLIKKEKTKVNKNDNVNDTVNDTVKKEHVLDYNNMLDELKAFLLYQTEICENAKNFERVEENKKWLQLFDKYIKRI